MGGKRTGNPDGRPLKQIDKGQFEALCHINPTISEVCAVFDCQDDTINSWCARNYDGRTFSEVLAQLGAYGRVSVRRKIWQKAMNDKDKDQWKAIDKLADKHLGMQAKEDQKLVVNHSPSKELKVTWQTVSSDEAKDYFDK